MNTLRLSTCEPGNAALLLGELAMGLKTSLETLDDEPAGILPPCRTGSRRPGPAAGDPGIDIPVIGAPARHFNGSGRAQRLRHRQAGGADGREQSAEYTDGACPKDSFDQQGAGDRELEDHLGE